jgi:hypothetical protein
MELGESDMELTMDNGEWVKIEDSRIWELERLGDRAESMVRQADVITHSPEIMAHVLCSPEIVELWNLLVDRGFINKPKFTPQSATAPQEDVVQMSSPSCEEIETPTPVVEDEEGRAQAPHLLWLYAFIPLLLCAIFVIVYKRQP